MPEASDPVKIEELDFYSFFTKYSLMEEYGFSSGLFSRIFRKVLPPVPDQGTVEYVLHHRADAIPFLLSLLDLQTIADSKVARQLDLSIKALCAKLIAFGLDSDIKAKYTFLALDSRPFEKLLIRVDDLTEANAESTEELIASLGAIERLIIDLRKNKGKIGVNLHLTLTTRRILEYTHRIKELLALKLNLTSEKHWEYLFRKYITYSRQKDSIRRYIKRNSDLLALEIVEHTSSKGEKYIAENRKEYWGFFYKALLGGGIIAVFAFMKLLIDSYSLSPLGDAFFFSLNYALCFIIVKQVGGIIATKQPAMTASTIAENIDKNDELKIDSVECVTILVRKVFRSQFISVVGNFLMALLFAGAIMYLLQVAGAQDLIKVVEPEYLIKKVVPTTQLVAFAAVAGCFLACSGLVAGYVDNKVVVAKIPYRIRYSRLFLRSERLATYVEQKAGGLLGNLFLGFCLGSTFLLSYLLPFSIDIRHIAFSSSYVGYSVMNYSFDLNTIGLALVGALLIGLVNFIVSFSITLYLALKSRRASFRLIPQIVFNILKDFLWHPLHYFFEMAGEPTTAKDGRVTK
jgi:site-specific recombinase